MQSVIAQSRRPTGRARSNACSASVADLQIAFCIGDPAHEPAREEPQILAPVRTDRTNARNAETLAARSDSH